MHGRLGCSGRSGTARSAAPLPADIHALPPVRQQINEVPILACMQVAAALLAAVPRAVASGFLETEHVAPVVAAALELCFVTALDWEQGSRRSMRLRSSALQEQLLPEQGACQSSLLATAFHHGRCCNLCLCRKIVNKARDPAQEMDIMGGVKG